MTHAGGAAGMPGPPGQQPSVGPAPGAPVAAQPKSINPDAIPSPVAVKDGQRELFADGYDTNSGRPPPAAGLRVRVTDGGSCHPAFMRSSLYVVPCTSQLINASKIPLVVSVAPFAELPAGSTPALVPLVDLGADGPVRCGRCKAFVNPHILFVDAGRRFQCNFCGKVNDVPGWYFCNVDAAGIRNDHAQRPELQCGSVDYVAPPVYSARPPQPPIFAFVIDVTHESVQNGMVGAVAQVRCGCCVASRRAPHTQYFPARRPSVRRSRAFQQQRTRGAQSR